MLYSVDSKAYARFMCQPPTLRPNQLFSNFGGLPEPLPPLPGTAATLCVKNKRYNGKIAIVLRGKGEGRVVVFVHELGAHICVPECSLGKLELPAEDPEEWWLRQIALGFPRLSEIANVYSDRVLNALKEMGLGRPELVVVRAKPYAKQMYCHQNAKEAAMRTPSVSQVFGYSLLPSLRCQCVMFESHSVIRDRDGVLLDVTPDWAGEHAKFFVAETMFDFVAMTDAADNGLIPRGTVYPFRDLLDGFPVIRCSQPCCENNRPLDERVQLMGVPVGVCKQAYHDEVQRDSRLFRDELMKAFPM